jgi:hypothetical protein
MSPFDTCLFAYSEGGEGGEGGEALVVEIARTDDFFFWWD